MIVQTEQGAPITAKVNRRVLLSCAMAWKTNKGQHLNIVSVSLSLYCAVSVTFVIIVNIIITIIIIASVNPRFQGSNPRLYNPRFHDGNPRLNQPQILRWQPQIVQPQISWWQPQIEPTPDFKLGTPDTKTPHFAFPTPYPKIFLSSTNIWGY